MNSHVVQKMSDQDLDQSYSALCNALASVGAAQAPLFLSMLCLSLMARSESAAQVLPLIAQAQQQCESES